MAERVFCTACGSIDDAASNRLQELQETVASQAIQIAQKVKTIRQLTQARAADHPAEYGDAMEVAQYWKEMLRPRARELNGPRLQKTIDRLQHGYMKSELLTAVKGYWIKPNMRKGRRVRRAEGGTEYTELSLIMRDAEHVDMGIEIAEAEEGFDSSYLNAGASPSVAALCDCGHPCGSHGLEWLQGHTGCYEPECRCGLFDDTATQWRLGGFRMARRAGKTDIHQGALL